MPAKYQMTASDQKRPKFTINDTVIPDDEQMPANKQTREKWIPKINQRSCLKLMILEKILRSIMLLLFIRN